MERIRLLPTELLNLICLFSWDRNLNETLMSCDVAIEVNSWDLHDIFIRRHHFDWAQMGYMESPLVVCAPNIPPHLWFRLDICYMLLQMLDFRRKEVRFGGNRVLWMKKLQRHWENIKLFSEYYLKMITDEQNWRLFGFQAVTNLEYYDLEDSSARFSFFIEP